MQGNFVNIKLSLPRVIINLRKKVYSLLKRLIMERIIKNIYIFVRVFVKLIWLKWNEYIKT